MAFTGFLREPLLHFLLLGGAIFAVDALLPATAVEDESTTIVITEGRQQQLAAAFARTWRRDPTPEEMASFVEGFVREEIYYREAVALGLDRDDMVVRRRMQQKMEFLATLQAETAEPGEAELAAFLAANPRLFARPARIAFLQVQVASGLQGQAALEAAADLLDQLRLVADPLAGLELGDRTLLPTAVELLALDQVERIFGGGFAEQLATLEVAAWAGPLTSAYGLHLVHVTGREDAALPPLEAILPQVRQAWREHSDAALREAQYQALRARYTVIFHDGGSQP